MKQSLLNLKNYQMVLNRIEELDQSLSFVPLEIQNLENEWKDLESRLTELKERLESQQTSITEKTIALEDANTKNKKFEHDLNEVTNSREYEAVLKEIDSIKKKVSTLTEDINKLSAEVTELEANIEETSQLSKESQSKYKSALRTHRGGMKENQAEMKKKQAEKKELADSIPANLMKRFARIAGRRNGMGLALCLNSVCTGCNVRVRQNVIDVLRHNNRVIQCESCKRILFFTEPEIES